MIVRSAANKVKVGINPVSRQNFQLLYYLNKNSECGKVYIFGKDVSQRIHLQNQISQKIMNFWILTKNVNFWLKIFQTAYLTHIWVKNAKMG